MSMQEREKEIGVHKDVLKAEFKAAEEERHKIAVELAERLNKVKNLKIKYESQVQKNKPSDGNPESVQEHSQAYYVIKAAQEREELQRKGDELNAKIIKSEKEIKALDNTLNHLKNRNSSYRDGFLNKGTTVKDVDQKALLEEQCRAASENLFKKKKELQLTQKEYEEDMRRFNEVKSRFDMVTARYQELAFNLDKFDKDSRDQMEKKERALKSAAAKANNLKQLKIVIDENSARSWQIQMDVESNLNKTFISALYMLNTEYPEMSAILEPLLNAHGIDLPNKPPTTIDIASSKGSQSQSASGRRY